MTEPRTTPPKTGGWSADQVKQFMDEQLAEVRRAVDVAREGEPPSVPLQYHFETVFGLVERADQRAERERERAAEALRTELARSIVEGDRALRDHIAAQVAEIKAALLSADLLEQERTGRIGERIDAERRITELTRHASDTAISKAEGSAAKQFDEFAKAINAQIESLRVAVDANTRRLDKTL